MEKENKMSNRKKTATVVTLFILLFFGSLAYLATIPPMTPLSPEEQAIIDAERELQEAIKYSKTHGFIVRIEQSNFNPNHWDSLEGQRVVVWDYAYTINLLDGTSKIKTRLNARLQMFVVRDFVRISSPNYAIYLVRAARETPK